MGTHYHQEDVECFDDFLIILNIFLNFAKQPVAAQENPFCVHVCWERDIDTPNGENNATSIRLSSCAYHAPRTASENCYVIFGASIMVAYNRRDGVGLSLFLRDKVQ